MSKKVIISGVSGQDGSLMADYLLKNTDYLIYGMVRRSAKPDYSNIQEALKNPRFKLVTGDLGDSQSIDNLVKEHIPDYFINFAAQSFVGTSWQIPEQTFDSGAVGVLRILEAVRKHSPHCRVYNAGSSEEFGDTITVPQDETHPLRPQSPYGAAKCAARHLIRVYRESYGLYAIQGILFNHEGVRRGEEFVTRKITKGVARIAKAIKEGKAFEPIELGNLDAKRDWSDAEDFVDGVWRMLNQDIYNQNLISKLKSLNGNLDDVRPKPESGKDYVDFFVKNIKEYVLSSNETHTVREFVELAFKAAGVEGYWYNNQPGASEKERFYIRNPKAEDAAEYMGDFGIIDDECTLVKINPQFYRPAEVKLLHGDSTLARNELKWEPKTSFPELVKKMVGEDLK